MLANFIFTNIIFSKRFKASNFRLRQRNDSVRGSKRKIKRKRERGKKRNDENKIESTRTIYARVFFLRSSVKVLRQSSWSKGYIKSSGGNVRKVLGLFFADKQLPRDILWQFESRKRNRFWRYRAARFSITRLRLLGDLRHCSFVNNYTVRPSIIWLAG